MKDLRDGPIHSTLTSFILLSVINSWTTTISLNDFYQCVTNKVEVFLYDNTFILVMVK